VNELPLDDIAKNLDETLVGVRAVTNGPDLKQALRSLSETLATVNALATNADASVGPALKRLPEIMQGLQTAVDKAGKLVGSADTGYGENSQFRRDVERLLDQLSDTARSIRLLANYLDQHPEALIRGRVNGSGER
jgi:paraquat-inducible protein B